MKSWARTPSTMIAVSLLSLLAQGAARVAVAQSAAGPPVPPNHRYHHTPKVEVFLGYSYFRSVPTLAAGNRMVDLNGGDASIAVNFSSHLAIVGDFGGYDDSQLLLTGTSVNEPRTVGSSGTVYTYLGGPRLSFRKPHRVSLFTQVLVGGVRASAVSIAGCSVIPCTPLPAQDSFALTAGGGVDVRLTHHIAIRPIQAEYMMTRFSSVPAGNSASQNDLRLSAGLVFLFGGRDPVIPPPPPPVVVPPPAPEVVKVYAPPTLTCSANPSSLMIGDTSIITANGVSPDNRPLTYSYGATAGQVAGTASTATLSTAGVAAGTITVTCNVVDDKGGAVSQTASVTVVAPPAPTLPTTSSLCSVSFERDSHRPTRVDNEGKACLDDIALNLQRSSDSRLALVGNAGGTERGGKTHATDRAANTKAYLVKEKGIDPSRISIYTGPQDGKTVSATLIPSGATLDLNGDTPVDEGAIKARSHL